MTSIPRGPQVTLAEDDEDGEVCINFELPQCRVDDLVRQLQTENSALKETFPLAHTAALEAVAPPSGRKVDDIVPQPSLAFDPIAKLARLRDLQERYAVVTEQREKAEQARKLMESMPAAGESTPMPPPAPTDSIGASFGLGAPATVPPAFPPAGGLPFPYAGVPGVLEPKVKAPPEPEVDIAHGDHFAEDEHALENEADARRLPKPEVLFVKDGMDMTLQQLRSHGQRMQQDVREMGRRLDEVQEIAEVRQLRTQPEVMDQFLRQQRIIHEQERKADELQYDIKLEQERQFWVEREHRQRMQRKTYGDRFPGAPDDNLVEGYDSTPPQLLLVGQARPPGMGAVEYKDVTDADGGAYPAMEYVLAPDSQIDVAPSSLYEDELMPSQAYRKNLLAEAHYKRWPPAPTFDPRNQIQDEPEGEAPATGARQRRARRQQQVAPGQGIQIGGGGARSSTAPLPPPDDAPPHEDAPASERLFMAGWRGGNSDAERQAVPFGAFAGDRELPSQNEVDERDYPGSSRRQRDGASRCSAEVEPVGGALSNMLKAPFAAFAGWTEAPAPPSDSGVADLADLHGGAGSRRGASRSKTPPRQLETSPRVHFARDVEGAEGAASGQRTPPPPFCAFAGDAATVLHVDDTARGGARARLRAHDRARTQTRPLGAPAAAVDAEDATPAHGSQAAITGPPARRSRTATPGEAIRPVGFDSGSEAETEPEETGFFGGLAAAVGLGGDDGGGGVFGREQQTPWEQEQRQLAARAGGGAGAAPARGVAARLDTGALFMTGACTERAPPMVPPDHALLEGLQGYQVVVETCNEVLSIRRAGKLGDRLSAQSVLNYVAAVAKNAPALASQGEASKHVSILVDVLNFYPVAVQIHLWALEGLVALFRAEDHVDQESLSGPIFDSVTTLMNTHVNDPSLHEKAPEMPRRILSALALVLTPATTPRLRTDHVDFTIGVIRASGVGPSLMEHGLQVLLVARIAHRIREQAMIARAALRSFKAEPRLVTRAFLTLGAAFEIAVEAAQPDEEPLAEGEAPPPTEEELLLDGTSVARLNPRGQELSGVKKRVWQQRLMDQAGTAHRALVETAPPLAGAVHVQGPTADGARHLIPIALRDIITGMDLYAQDRKVQGAAAVALAASVMLPSVSPRAMKAEGAVRALILAQQHFSTSRSIALHLCQVLVQFARKENTMLSVDVAVTAIHAGVSFARDAEVSVTAIQVVHAFALRLHELCPDRSSRLNQMAADLVRLGEGRHSNPHALGMLLVIFVAAASDGRGTGPGGVAGEQWRVALAGAAAVVVPLRVLYEHVDNVDLVLTAAITLRVLTYGNMVSAAHASRLRGLEALLGTIQKHHHRPDMARELLAALGNVGVDPAARELFSSKLPDSAEAIYNAMEKSGSIEPDVLAQGCRAIGALTVGPRQETVRFAIDQNRIDKAISKTSAGISSRIGVTEDTSAGGYLEIFTGTAEATQMRQKKLRTLCGQLMECMIASGPQFGRLVGKDGELLAEVQPRRHAARARTPTGQRATRQQ